jgi:formamidopyrimidine-DNA glycosylase
MPELPDLQVFSANLDKKLSGNTVKEVIVHNSKKLNVKPDELNKTLQGQKLKEVYRDGKELHLKFSKGDVLALHLMLHGGLNLFEGKNDAKYTIIEIDFEDGVGLALTDWQSAATPTLNPEEKPGVDALQVDQKFLQEKLGKSRTIIKTLLMDQKVIRGIGNAYADEILYEAGISPFSVSNKIPENKVKTLAKAIKTVLQEAEKHILKEKPDIISGEVRSFLKVHATKKKETPNGETIHVKEGTRKTYYTDEQELYQ